MLHTSQETQVGDFRPKFFSCGEAPSSGFGLKLDVFFCDEALPSVSTFVFFREAFTSELSFLSASSAEGFLLAQFLYPRPDAAR